MINTKYSFKDFTQKDLSGEPAADFNNTEIVGSCFYQDSGVDVEIFPTGMTGVTFQRCNLDNVLVPAGNTVESSCINRHIILQNDLEDWICDKATGTPIEPTTKVMRLKLGISCDSKDIPSTKLSESVTMTALKEKNKLDEIAELQARIAELTK